MVNSSSTNNTAEQGKGQESQPESHPRDGYIIIQRQILNEGFTAYELSFLITCLLIAEHKKQKTPGVVKASTIELGQLMGASQKTAWKCKQALIARGIIKPLAAHEFIIVNYEAYQSLARTSLVPQTNELVSQTNGKSHRLTVSPTDYSPDINQIAELNNKRSKSIKEVIAPPTTDESKILNILKELKGWRYDEADDVAWLREFMSDYPGFSIAQAKACRDYYSGRAPPKHKGVWKNRLRNWMTKEQEYEKEVKTGVQPRKGVRPKPNQGRVHPVKRIDGQTGEER